MWYGYYSFCKKYHTHPFPTSYLYQDNVGRHNQLSTINSSIENVADEIRNVNTSINNMNKSLTSELKGINNKLWWNNLFQAVQIYQNRRTNKLLSR